VELQLAVLQRRFFRLGVGRVERFFSLAAEVLIARAQAGRVGRF
jgi:hypothetical protein